MGCARPRTELLFGKRSLGNGVLCGAVPVAIVATVAAVAAVAAAAAVAAVAAPRAAVTAVTAATGPERAAKVPGASSTVASDPTVPATARLRNGNVLLSHFQWRLLPALRLHLSKRGPTFGVMARPITLAILMPTMRAVARAPLPIPARQAE